MNDVISNNVLRRFRFESDSLSVIADDTFMNIADSIKKCQHNAKIILLSRYDENSVAEVFDSICTRNAVLIAEPATYIKYRLYKYLDFSKGEPRIPGSYSKVLIFPFDSVCRIFSGSFEDDLKEKEVLVNRLRNNQKYRITTDFGTDLVFESRQWIPLDFEVCTAPTERLINGVIAVDGALFFREIDEIIHFSITNGKIASVTATTPEGKQLIDEYNSMTSHDFENSINLQLAEIGIGFCKGAKVSDCFMEAEAAANTCHFCFGNNTCYGGNNSSDFHGASVLIKKPDFECIG